MRIPSSLTLGVGAQVDFHAGLHLIFSTGHGRRSRRCCEKRWGGGGGGVEQGGGGSGSLWKRKVANGHVRQVKPSQLLRQAVVSAPSSSTQEILPSHVYIVASLSTRPLQRVQTAHRKKSKNNTKKMHVNQTYETTLRHGS